MEIYEKLIGLDDHDPAVRHRMAEYYYDEAGKLEADAAESMLRKTLEYMTRSCEISREVGNPADPGWVTVHCQRLNLLSMLHHELGNTGDEIEGLREIVWLDPAFPGACYNLGVLAHKAEKFNEAIDYYRQGIACADDAHKAELYYQIGIIYLKEFGDHSQAITAFTAALEADDGTAKEMVHYLRGTAYYDEAETLACPARNAGELDVLIENGTLNLDRADRASDFFTKALEDFRQVVTANPDVARSTRQHIDSIARLQERLARTRQKIDRVAKTR